MRSIRFMGGSDCEGANVSLGHGVVVQLSRSGHGKWEAWGVEIDGHLYREPRDLEGEPLVEGDFREWVEREFEDYEQANRIAAHAADAA